MTENNNLQLISFAPDVQANTDFCSDWTLLFSHQIVTTPSFFGHIQHYINAKGLACPMPLLKLKMTLKHTQPKQTIYLTATDPNSEHDIAAFCQHMGHDLVSVTSNSQLGKNLDTIFHLFITKNS